MKILEEKLQKEEQDFPTKEQEANATFQELEKQKQELQTNLDTIDETIGALETQYNSIIEGLKDTTLTAEQKNALNYGSWYVHKEINKIVLGELTIFTAKTATKTTTVQATLPTLTLRK